MSDSEQQKKVRTRPIGVQISLPVRVEQLYIFDINVDRNMTGRDLARYVGASRTSAIKIWPTHLPLRDEDRIYNIIASGRSLYLEASDPPSLGDKCLHHPRWLYPTPSTDDSAERR